MREDNQKMLTQRLQNIVTVQQRVLSGHHKITSRKNYKYMEQNENIENLSKEMG